MNTIVLTGINVFENRGTEALAISIVEGLLALPSKPKVIVITRDMVGAKASLGPYGVDLVEDQTWVPPSDASPMTKLKVQVKQFVRRNILGRLQPQEKVLKAANLVVVSGGDIFSSDYTIMGRYLHQLALPLAEKIPVMFFAQSIGPFKTEAERTAFRLTAQQATVTVRENISVDYLTNTLGLEAQRVTMTADPAFLLAVPDRTRDAMMQAYGLTPGTYVAAACSRSISGFTGITHEQHVEAWVVAAKELMDLGEKLVLVPHVQMPEAHQNDLALAKEIHAALDHDPRCIVMDQKMHGSVEFKAVLKGAQFVVAERTHGAIGAMSSGVPTLSIGYSIKAEGVLRQLIQDEDMVGRSLVGAPEFTAAKAAGIIHAAWNDRQAFTDQLEQNLPIVKHRSQQTFEIAGQMLKA